MLAYGSTYPPLQDSHISPSSDPTPVYDPRGRQKNFVESAMQRKERIEFLKQREWVRRVTEWVKETNVQKCSVRCHFLIDLTCLDFSCSSAHFRSPKPIICPVLLSGS